MGCFGVGGGGDPERGPPIPSKKTLGWWPFDFLYSRGLIRGGPKWHYSNGPALAHPISPPEGKNHLGKTAKRHTEKNVGGGTGGRKALSFQKRSGFHLALRGNGGSRRGHTLCWEDKFKKNGNWLISP